MDPAIEDSEQANAEWLETSDTLLGSKHSFLVTVRVWKGESGNKQMVWRGMVEHADTRKRIYFIRFSRLVEFIASHSGIVTSLSTWQSLSLLVLGRLAPRQWVQRLNKRPKQ